MHCLAAQHLDSISMQQALMRLLKRRPRSSSAAATTSGSAFSLPGCAAVLWSEVHSS